MRPSARQRSISAALACSVLAATPVLASPRLDTASKEAGLAAYRATVERGTAAFVGRRFSEARQAFEQAFSIHPDPVLVFNIASCWRRDGNTAEALLAYRRFLALAPNDDARRMLAEETIAALEAEPSVAPAASIELSQPPPRVRSVWRPIGVATTTVGAVSLIVGAVELVRARSLGSDSSTDDQSRSDGQHDGQWDGDGDSRNWDDEDDYESESAKRRGIVLGAAGAAVIAAGLTMYVIGRRSERALQVTATAGSTGGQVVLGGRF